MKRGAKTNRSGKVLEYVFEQLSHYGFQEIKGIQIYNVSVFPNRYVWTHAQYLTIYQTTGYHEGLIVADKQNFDDFIQVENAIEIVIECKFQSGSGSVDEKIPYIFENFLNSKMANWILVLDGNWWTKSDRGKAVVQYAKRRAEELTNGQ